MVVALVALSIAQGNLPDPQEVATAAAGAAAGSKAAAWTSAAALLVYVGSYQVRPQHPVCSMLKYSSSFQHWCHCLLQVSIAASRCF
jgi:hypothetical protein